MFSSYSLHWWISKVFQVINLWFQVIDACYCTGVLKRQETEDHPLPRLIWTVFSFPPFRFLFFIPVCPFPNVWEPCGKDEKLAPFLHFFATVFYHSVVSPFLTRRLYPQASPLCYILNTMTLDVSTVEDFQ